MWPNPQLPVDLVTFLKKSFMKNLFFVQWINLIQLKETHNTAQNTVISLNFLRKLCLSVKFLHRKWGEITVLFAVIYLTKNYISPINLEKLFYWFRNPISHGVGSGVDSTLSHGCCCCLINLKSVKYTIAQIYLQFNI